MPECTYVAKALTEEKVILLMMEHAMVTHPKKVGELMATISREGIVEMMRKEIKREVDFS